MTDRLEVLSKQTTVSDFGSTRTDWVPVRIVRAELVKDDPSAVHVNGEHFAGYSKRWRLHRAEIKILSEGSRVRQVGGYLYNVNNILDNPRRGFITIVCARVNQ